MGMRWVGVDRNELMKTNLTVQPEFANSSEIIFLEELPGGPQ
jgi:hypothetical protein